MINEGALEMNKKNFPNRDFIGYGLNIPNPKWPKNAKLAISFVINYEEGAESCTLNGDPTSEHLLSEIIGATPIKGRNLNIESLYEYGSRAGFYRLHNAFMTRQVPYTAFACGLALQLNQNVVNLMAYNDLVEVASHGHRWLDYQNIDEDTEKEHIEKSCTLHKEMFGQDAIGFYQGKPSVNTKRLLAENPKILYCNDSYADDLPYYDYNYNPPLLIIPYTLDVNDMRFVTSQGFHNSKQFYTYLKDTFDTLLSEGSSSPKMMSIGLHARIIGHPGRLPGLIRFFDYIAQFEKDIWICQRGEIAKHWLHHFPASTLD